MQSGKGDAIQNKKVKCYSNDDNETVSPVTGALLASNLL